jgi:putative glutamine amidotransferase
MNTKRPLIGCTTYRRQVSADPEIWIDGLMPTYTSALLAAGAIPVLIPLTLAQPDLLELFTQLDGVLLPGGGDIDPARYGGQHHPTLYGIDPLRDEVEVFVAQQAVAQDKPLLAICRGHQMLNVALGGSLWEDVLDLMPEAHRHAYFQGFPRSLLSHEVHLAADSRLARILGQSHKPVNSLHHQGIRTLGANLRPMAHAADGLIESIEVVDHRFAIGVQWHPEEFFQTDTATLALFQAFVEACR